MVSHGTGNGWLSTSHAAVMVGVLGLRGFGRLLWAIYLTMVGRPLNL